METRILNAGSRAIELEKRLYEGLKGQILDAAAALGLAAKALAELDVATAFATLARAEYWTAPKLDTSRTFHIEGGRHPVVETALKSEGAPLHCQRLRPFGRRQRADLAADRPQHGG